ncbi:MAG: GspH/FimT family pseudopilin [Pseudomonas sp.]|uniref:GspH/FimT family pseudopilin n=1 Tax=Pseudomonas sp. TaxID=306 RepID=UPI003BB5001D
MSRLDKTQGFTLVELMITLALLAIVATIAVPSFTQFIHNNQIKAAAEELKTFLMFARDQAINNKAQVKLIFNDSTAWEIQRPSKQDEVIRTLEHSATQAKIVALNSNRTAAISELLYRPSGVASAGASFTICRDNKPADGYLITVEPSGSIELHPKGKKENNTSNLVACE